MAEEVELNLDELEAHVARDGDALGFIGLDRKEARELVRRARELHFVSRELEKLRLEVINFESRSGLRISDGMAASERVVRAIQHLNEPLDQVARTKLEDAAQTLRSAATYLECALAQLERAKEVRRG